jgi:magnesium-protoporphyrin IX monomethyl ester (oxidative) cyclase
MRVLLINPYVEQMYRELNYAENFRTPLGLAYCAAYIERAGHEVEILDALVLKVTFPRLRKILLKKRPHVVGISTYSPTRYECFRTAKVVKETLGEEVKVVAGGPHVSAAPDDTLRFVSPIDYVVRGEGEETLLELLEALESRRDPAEVMGTSSRKGDQIYHAPDRPNIKDLDALPYPGRHLLPMKRYGTRMPSTMHRCTTVLTSRGCPARCIFCTRDWFSREVRYRSPENMVLEVEEVLKRYKMPSVIFQDDTFTLDMNRTFEFCEAIHRRNLRFKWLATTRVDRISLDLLKAMKAAGCEVITVGAESMIPKTLTWLRKGFTVENVRRAIGWAREAGLIIRCSYLIGVGDETEEDVRDSVRLARELQVHKLKANVGLSVYPGTPLYKMALDAGVLPENYSFARNYEDPGRRYGNNETPRWYTDHVNLDRLIALRKETEVNILFTRPSIRTVAHRTRKFVSRFRRHPADTTRHVSQFFGALVKRSDLRRMNSDHPSLDDHGGSREH